MLAIFKTSYRNNFYVNLIPHHDEKWLAYDIFEGLVISIIYWDLVPPFVSFNKGK